MSATLSKFYPYCVTHCTDNQAIFLSGMYHAEKFQGFSVFLSSDLCRLGSRPQRGAGQEERGAGNPATRGCLHLSPLASIMKTEKPWKNSWLLAQTDVI